MMKRVIYKQIYAIGVSVSKDTNDPLTEILRL